MANQASHLLLLGTVPSRKRGLTRLLDYSTKSLSVVQQSVCHLFTLTRPSFREPKWQGGTVQPKNVHISGCGSVGRAVTSDTRGPRFESSRSQNFYIECILSTALKRRNKEKDAGNGPFLKRHLNIILIKTTYHRYIWQYLVLSIFNDITTVQDVGKPPSILGSQRLGTALSSNHLKNGKLTFPYYLVLQVQMVGFCWYG